MTENNKAIPYGNNCLGLENGKLVIEERKQVSVKARIFDDGSIKIEPNEDIKTKLRPLRGKNIIITFEEDK